MKPPKKRPNIEQAWKILLRMDKDARWFTDDALHRMTKASRRACYNWISQWLKDELVEEKPTQTGWRRQVRRIVEGREPFNPAEPEPVATEVAIATEPEADTHTPNPYVTAVAEYGQAFIDILCELRDTALDSRVRFSAAAALAEFNCVSPGSAQDAPVVDDSLAAKTAALEWLAVTKSAISKGGDHLDHNALVEQLSAVVLAQYGQEELGKVLNNSVCKRVSA